MNVMNNDADLLQWLINFLIKMFLVVALKMKLCQTKNKKIIIKKEIIRKFEKR